MSKFVVLVHIMASYIIAKAFDLKICGVGNMYKRPKTTKKQKHKTQTQKFRGY